MAENSPNAEKTAKQIELEALKNRAELLDVKDVLSIINTSKTTFLDWVKKDKLPKGLVIRIGLTIKIRKPIFIQWLNGEIA